MLKKPTLPKSLDDALSIVDEANQSNKSNLPPSGCVRLAVNLKKEHHKKLKQMALDRGTTIRSIIEEMINKYN